MLATAISDIERAGREAEEERRRRDAGKRTLRRAESYLGIVEDMVEDELPAVPEPLFGEITGFVRSHSRRLARTLRQESGSAPAAVLDVLFELEERVQRQHGDLAAAA